MLMAMPFWAVTHSEEASNETQIDSTVVIINGLLSSRDDHELVSKALDWYDKDPYISLALNLAATRENINNSVAAYNAACDLLNIGAEDTAFSFLEMASERGMLDYQLLESDDSMDSIRNHPRFLEIAANMKQKYDKIAKETVGQMDYVLPTTKADSEQGYPVFVWLHGYRINGDVQGDAFLTQANVAIMGVNGTHLEDWNAFSWDLENYSDIHHAIQKGLDELSSQANINRDQVYLYGFSQGAAASARLLASYPDSYKGGLIVAPSYFDADLPNDAKGQRIILTHGKDDYENIQKSAQLIEPAFKKNNQIRTIVYEGQHHFPRDYHTKFVEYFNWLQGKTD